MDRKHWCSTSSRTIRLGRQYHETDPHVSSHSARSNRSRWSTLWMKLKKEKKKIFDSPSSTRSVKLQYDPFSYSQNFDQGCSWDQHDADDLSSRSFSMRFAVPSNIFQKGELLAWEE
uniref:uncharacterized protein LOC105353124 n=1 Tax=Fragaria vesca subsp. vesca TaxID=101020 RepID=UPI0005C8E4E7|nr:PREDICTED: uncharacterized protein LOC105353124 [Fragaria vesca subsp. vesca]